MSARLQVTLGGANALRSTALLLVCLFLSACGTPIPDDTGIRFAGVTMGTTFSVTLTHLPAHLDVRQVELEITRILDKIEGKMSTYRDDSELSQLNRSESMDWVSVSEDLLTVIAQALHVSKLTNGAFDVTVGPLVNLWGFGPPLPTEQIPSEERINEMMGRVDYQRLHARGFPPAVRKDAPDISIDLSAIAQGYAVDKVAEYLESAAVPDYLVEVGGELRAQGRNPVGSAWRIGIERPTADQSSVQEVILLDNQAVATSGDYRNYFEQNGQRYSHILNPKTGRPVTHNLASVTIISSSTMYADAMATGLMVLGPEIGYALAVREQLAAYLILREADGFRENATPAFKRYLVHKIDQRG
jgi:Membrane-associated lipoprotein involved in thiamine biosynthesis